jgi:hypothetical protein
MIPAQSKNVVKVGIGYNPNVEVKLWFAQIVIQ